MNDLITLSNDIDLVYSPDDGGWYLQKFDPDRVSIIYETSSDALKAYAKNEIEWEDETDE